MLFSKRWLLRGALLIVLLLGATVAVAASGLFVEPDVDVLYTIDGEQAGDWFGWVAEGLGDIDGDGVSDWITTAPFYDGTVGKAYVYSGADGTLLNELTGQAGAYLGYAASATGDVNADGTPDYVVGAPGADTVQVYSGADHSLLLDLSAAPGSFFGADVNRAGDVNGDGHDDVIVGATGASISYSQAGRVTVFSGADGSPLWSVDGFGEGHSLGGGVGRVGDVNGDGTPDQVASAQGAGRKDNGEAYVLDGSDGSVIHTLLPVGRPGSSSTFGLFHAADAGDVNGDGVPDVYVGDYGAQRGQFQGKNAVPGGITGRAYVFSGADGSRLYVFDAEQNGDGFGPGRGVGDVNGDGYDDLYIASYRYSSEVPYVGKAYVYSGKNGSVLRTMTGTTPGGFLGIDALSVGDLNGDGHTDYALTGFGFVDIIAGNP